MLTPDETPWLNIRQELGKTAMPKSWRDWFDALQAAGVDRVADESVGVRRGMFPPQQPTQSGYDPAFQSSAVQASGSSNQINAQPVMGLQRVNEPMPESHGIFMGRMAAAGLRGRGQQNLRVQTQRGGPFGGRR